MRIEKLFCFFIRLQLRSSDSGQSQCPQVIWYTLTPKRHDRGQCPLGVKRTDLGPKTVASRHCPPPRSTLTRAHTRPPRLATVASRVLHAPSPRSIDPCQCSPQVKNSRLASPCMTHPGQC